MNKILTISILLISQAFAQDFNTLRVRKLLSEQQQIVVNYRNSLGEGLDGFDPLPRSNLSEVNCTTWWQQILAQGYAKDEGDFLRILDRIRYYEGRVSFGTRKHFLDTALILERTPFKKIEGVFGQICETDKKLLLTLDHEKFKTHKKYFCSLIGEQTKKIEINYLSPQKSKECIQALSPGIYMIFPIAGNRYNKIWGKNSGPMGHVHGIILDIQTGRKATIYHASVSDKKVSNTSFDEYINSTNARLFLGYNIYNLEPVWGNDSSKKFEKIHKEILSCEKKLVGR